MITGVLNTLLQADNTDLTRKLDASEKRVGRFKGEVERAGAGGFSRVFESMGQLSGLGDRLGGSISRITFFGANVRTVFEGISSGVGNAQADLAASSGVFARMLGFLSNPVVLVTGSIIALTAAAAGAAIGLHSMASHGAAQIREIYDLANNLELSSAALTAFSLAPGLRGIEDIGTNMYRLQASLGNLGTEGREVLRNMQVDLDQLSAANAEQQIRMLAAGYARLDGQTERAGATRTLFGRGGMAMMDLLEQGTEGLDRLQARAERLGLTFSDAQAMALRRANAEWAGFGLALQGIGRQAAIMFTPLWESIGRVGTAIGEWLVGTFRRAMPLIEQVGRLTYEVFRFIYQAFGGGLINAAIGDMAGGFLQGIRDIIPWLKIVAEVATSVFRAAANAIQFVMTGIWRAIRFVGELYLEYFTPLPIVRWVAEFLGGWNNIQDAALGVMAAIVVALERPLAAWAALETAGRLVWANLKIAVAEWAESAILQARRVLSAIRQSLPNPDSVGGIAMLNRMTDLQRLANQAVQIQNDAREEVNQLNQPGNPLLAFGASVNQLVARWRDEIRGIFGGIMGPQQPPGAPSPWTYEKAITGHEAATADSQRAFSLQYGTRGNMEMYARATAEEVRRSREEQQIIRRTLERAPVIRRANLR